MEQEFAIANILPGKLNALVKNMMRLMGIKDPIEAVRRINAGEWTVSRADNRWQKNDDVVYIMLPVTDGTTGVQWVNRLRNNRFQIGNGTESILYSDDFCPTSGVINVIAIISGKGLTNLAIKDEAGARSFSEPYAEVACLIRENFSDNEMELMGFETIVVEHKPIRVSESLSVVLSCQSGRFLHNYFDSAEGEWGEGVGFAFCVAQIFTKK